MGDPLAGLKRNAIAQFEVMTLRQFDEALRSG
jgi:hypothetical protein